MKHAVRAFIRNDEGKFLLIFHDKKNNWTPPGGKVDENEKEKDSLIRELFEEIEFLPDNDYDLSNVYKVSETITHEDSSENWVIHLYFIKTLPKNFMESCKNKEPNKHSAMRWFSIQEIEMLEMKSYSTKLLLSMYKALDEFVENNIKA